MHLIVPDTLHYEGGTGTSYNSVSLYSVESFIMQNGTYKSSTTLLPPSTEVWREMRWLLVFP